MLKPVKYNTSNFDVTIIGGGVIGSLVAYKMAKYNIKVCLIEMYDDLACGTTGANSAIIHGGYDPEPGTLKAKYNILGQKQMESLCSDLDVPLINNGALVLSFSQKEDETIKVLYERGIENGVPGLELLTKEQVIEIEPNISPLISSALSVPNSSIISPFELTYAAGEVAAQNGVEFFFEHEVVDIVLKTENEEENFDIRCKVLNEKLKKNQFEVINSKIVINCAGVASDKIAGMIGDKSFTIIARRGEYIVLDKIIGEFVKNTIFQSPTEDGKGVLVTPSVDGNILVGPNSKVVSDPFDVTTTYEGIDYVREFGLKSVPNLDMKKMIRTFAGVRATSSTGDFIIEPSSVSKSFINVAGIDSPGLSASPAIADEVEKICLKTNRFKIEMQKDYITKRTAPIKFSELSFEEQQKLIEKDPLYANIVCRCENVTMAEVLEAIRRPIGAKTLNAIKIRTRAGTGRCQGSFCLPRLLPIIAEELDINLEDVTLNGAGSEILKGKKR